MKPGIPVNLDDFKPLSKLVAGYELDPTKVYLIVCDGKDFSVGAAYALMRDIQQMHPDLNVAITATLKPKSIGVREKADEEKKGTRSAEALPGADTGTTEDPR